MKYLFNRATYGSYNPGSTFKIVTALACFEHGILNVNNVHDRIHTLGYYRLGRNHVIDDTAAAGDYDFNRAFIKSSNSYFIENGLKLGIDHLLDYARLMHLGEKPGLRLNEEATGIVPRREDVSAGGIPGKTANLSIGQELTVTPVQLAMVIAAVANGGTVYWPRLIDRFEPGDRLSDAPIERVRAGQVRTQLDIKREHIEIIHAAMRDDVALDEGTGKNARVKDFVVCGKTGTAEVKAGSRLIDRITWFASFGPYESPRYAVVVMVESGGSDLHCKTGSPPRVRIDGPLDRTQDLGNGLPLVEENGLSCRRQRGIRIGAECNSLRSPVEANDGPRVPRSCRRLAGSSRPDEKHRRKFGEQRGQGRVDHPGKVGGHGLTIPLSRSHEYRFPAPSSTALPQVQALRAPGRHAGPNPTGH
jgi:hypothetical protein